MGPLWPLCEQLKVHRVAPGAGGAAEVQLVMGLGWGQWGKW